MGSNAAFTETEARRRISALEIALRAGHPPPMGSHGGGKTSVYVAAKALGLSRQTLHSSIVIMERVYGLKPDWSLWKDARAIDAIADAEPEWRRKERRYLDRIDGLSKQLAGVQREQNADDDLRSAVFRLADQPIDPPKWMSNGSGKSGGITGVPILFTSDFQFGEVVKKNEMAGINEFNPAVAVRRYKLLIDKTIDLSFNHMVKPKYPGIIYIRGGDSVSGEIHDELERTNALEAIPAVKQLVEMEAAGIEALAHRFGHVHVVSVPGNHGRVHRKPYSKRYAETNYDTLSAWMLEQWYRADGRITFHTPDSGDALISVYGWNFLLTHGDRIGSRGGGGFIGPAATITRGMKKLVDYYATLGVAVDGCMVGHFHTAMELEYGWSNGSLPGMSEYGRDGRFRPAPPKQWLLFVHPDHGVTARWLILLEKPMRNPGSGEPITVRPA